MPVRLLPAPGFMKALQQQIDRTEMSQQIAQHPCPEKEAPPAFCTAQGDHDYPVRHLSARGFMKALQQYISSLWVGEPKETPAHIESKYRTRQL